MSNRLSGSFELNRLVAGAKSRGAIPKKSISIATDSNLMYQSTQVVGVAADALAYGDVTADALLVIENEDTDADDGAVLSVGHDSGGFVEWFWIPAGEFALLPRVGSLAAVKLQSDTAATNVSISLYKIVPPA